MFMDNFSMYWKYSKLEVNYHTQIICFWETMSIEDHIQSKQSHCYAFSN